MPHDFSKYRILFSDVDRTLLTHSYEIPPRVLEAIASLRRRGVEFVLSTARSPRALRPYAKLLACTDLCICFNGAWIGDIETSEAIFEGPLPRSIALAVIEQTERLGLDALWYTNDGAFSLRDTDDVRREVDLTGELLTVVSTAVELPDNPYKIMCIGAGEQKHAKLAAVRLLGIPGVSFAQSSEMLLEIISETTSKGSAASIVARLRGISADQCIAAGDGENDLTMLNFAGLRLTIANAIEPIKAIADFIGGTCENGGLADGLKWVFAEDLTSSSGIVDRRP